MRGLLIALTLPALLRASRMLSKAERVGFLWTSREEARAKVEEELQELLDAESEQARADEFGDLLLSLVSYAHFQDVEPESALREAQNRFDERFRQLEARLERDGKTLRDCSPEVLSAYWSETTAD